MLTVGSIMATQNSDTFIVFHSGVVGKFKTKHILKLYSLKNRINNYTEFNFYNLKGAMEIMKNFHHKGEACP